MPITYQYGPPADITGPCLVTNCQTDTYNGNANCLYTVQKCTAGSSKFDNPVDPTDQQEACSLAYQDSTQQLSGTCTLKPLSGDLLGSGKSWSLVDGSTTQALPYTAQSIPGSSETVTYLYVDFTSTLGTFLTKGAAEAATAVVTTTGTSGSSVKTSAKSTSVSKTTGTGAVTTTTGTPSTTTGTPSSTSVTAATSTGGQEMKRVSKMGLCLAGVLLGACLV